MEIRSVVNEVKNEYPKMEQVSEKHLSSSIPNKWIKVGLSSLGIVMIMKKYVFAEISVNANYMDIAGGVPLRVPLHIKICELVCPIVRIVSAVVFIITGLSILLTKIKSKKQSEPKKVSKGVKVIFIISILLFLLSILIPFIISK